MAYNKSRRAVLRMLKPLETLYKTRETVEWQVAEPNKFAMNLREAIKASAYHTDFSHFKELEDDYQIKLVGTSVVAQKISRYEDEPTKIGGKTPVEEGRKSLTIPDATDVVEVVGSTIVNSGAEELFFPNALLLEEEKANLFIWSRSSGWKYIDHHGEGVTLTKKEVEEWLLWKPENESNGK